MKGWTQALTYLPEPLRAGLDDMESSFTGRVQEIRLRREAPVALSAVEGDYWISSGGRLLRERPSRSGSLYCTAAMLDECFLKLCGYSIHTHQEELRQGFVTTADGFRVGVGGTMVTDREKVTGVRDITSLCLRIARSHPGCAGTLLPLVIHDGRPCSLLLCGEPASGKSSLLRDLAVQLADRRYRVVVVDERGELSQTALLACCDVVRGCSKGRGIRQAVRCLSPDVVLFDEWGTAEETQAVIEGLNAGVAAIATAHCRSVAELLRRPALTAALAVHAFDRVAFLVGRQQPGQVSTTAETGDLLVQMDRSGLCLPGGYGDRFGGLGDAASAGLHPGGGAPADRTYRVRTAVYGGTDRCRPA